MFAIRFPISNSRFPIAISDSKSRFPIRADVFPIRADVACFRFPFPISIRDAAISRFRDFAIPRFCDFAIPRFRDSAIPCFWVCFFFRFHDSAIPVSRFRNFDFTISRFLGRYRGGPGLRPYTVRPAEHGNSRETFLARAALAFVT